MTISGSLLTVQVDGTDADIEIGEGYRGEIVVVHNSSTYNGVILFDVVGYLLRSPLTVDQLVDRDDTLRSADWAGDDDLSGLIEACRDELQILVESVAFESQRALETMALDHAKFGVCHRLYVLKEFWAVRDEEKAERYERKFSMLWKAFINSITWDTNQDGEEDDGPGNVIQVRLLT